MKAPTDLSVTPEQRAEFTRLMTGGRMSAYDTAATLAAQQQGLTVDSLDFYVYNMALAGALLGPLHMLEVITRNAMHHELATFAGQEDWWVRGSKVTLLDRHYIRVADFEKKVRRDLRGTRPLVPGDIVAASDLGFWTGLLGKGSSADGADYEQLWKDVTKRAFPNTRQKRDQVWPKFNALRVVRNRVGHHEHIFRTDPNRNLATIVELIGFVSPPLAEWVDDRSRVADVSARHPFTGQSVTHY